MSRFIYGPISETSLRRLKHYAEIIPYDEFHYWLALYFAERNDIQMTPAKARDALADLVTQADELIATLQNVIDDGAAWGYLADRGLAFGDYAKPLVTKADIRLLSGMAESARREAEIAAKAGRKFSPETRFIHRLAKAIEMAGGRPDAKPNGPLVQAFGIAMTEIGRPIKDAKGTVKSAQTSYKGRE